MREGWLKIGDREIFYRLRGEGRPLLLLHGFLGSLENWSLVFPEPLRGYEHIEIDLSAHGRSTGYELPFTFRQCGDDILAVLASLGITRATAIGLSGGGQALLHAATKQPRMFDALVLVSTAHYFPASARALMAERSPAAYTPVELVELAGVHAFGARHVRCLTAFGHAMKDDVEDVAFDSNRLARLAMPVLVHYGDQDPLYSVAVARELCASLPDATLQIAAGKGHGDIFVGEDRDAFVIAVARFLEAVHSESARA